MILLIGYGNPGRCDDGLGPAFADRIARRNLPGVEVVIDFQLKVEHALLIAEAATILFADAQMGGEKPFSLEPLAPVETGDVSSHSLSPASVLALAETLYGAAPAAFLLGISGQEFGHMHDALSQTALRNLDLAEKQMLEWLDSLPRAVKLPLPVLPAVGVTS